MRKKSDEVFSGNLANNDVKLRWIYFNAIYLPLLQFTVNFDEWNVNVCAKVRAFDEVIIAVFNILLLVHK